LRFDAAGLLRRGLVVRHLVLPEQLAGSAQSLEFLKSLAVDLQLSLMAQYRPSHRSACYPELDRALRAEEYQAVVDLAKEMGFENVYSQELESAEHYLPDFDKAAPFE
jgi:putative pyruvate formate lyase activating enzyme